MEIFLSIFIWWLWMLLLGIIGLPVTMALFRRLPGRGAAFARPISWLLSGYLLWLGGSLGIWRNTTGGTLFAMLVVFTFGLWLLYYRTGQSRRQLMEWLKENWRYLLTSEIIFACALFGWGFFKAYNPNIETAGGEKWMEIAFINSLLRSGNFPPQDPWLSGFGISYYYFGYLLMAMIIRLSGLASTIGYNLCIPTLLGLSMTGAFGIAAEIVAASHREKKGGLKKALGAGVLLDAALFTTILGNWEGLLEILHQRGLLSPAFWTWLDISDLKAPAVGNGWIPDRFMWWWRGSRVLTDYDLLGREQEVIDEFPFFSFLLGDVHPHVLALPFVLLAILIAFQFYNTQKSLAEEQPPPATLSMVGFWNLVKRSAGALLRAAGGGWELFLLAVSLGALGFLNTWDLPIYLLVIMLAFALWRRRVSGEWFSETMIAAIILGAGSIFLYLPFYLTFASQAKGIFPNLYNPTRLPQFVIFFGPFLTIFVLYLLMVIRQKKIALQDILRYTLLIVIVGLAAWILLATAVFNAPASGSLVNSLLADHNLQAIIGGGSRLDLAVYILQLRLFNPWVFLCLALLGGCSWALLSRETDSGEAMDIDQFLAILCGVGVLLPFMLEIFYLRDNFGTRMNSVFKFYFQAWVLLALGGTCALHLLNTRLHGWPKHAVNVIVGLAVIAGMAYPILAIPNKMGNLGGAPTLDGMAWMSQVYPDDYSAIKWLQNHGQSNDIVLECPGSGAIKGNPIGSYNYVSRVSALTGMPTLLGWGGHEAQWRGNYNEPGKRESDIETIYQTTDPQKALTLIARYHITYVYVGDLERERYSSRGLDKFSAIMRVAYQQGHVTIYHTNF
jgi:YYY domain-containing protein